MARSRVEGAELIKRVLQRIPEGATEGLRRSITEESYSLHLEMKQAAPADSVADAFQVKIGGDGLSARVGLVDKRNKQKGFLGYIFEFGASAHFIEAGASNSRRRTRPKKVLRTEDGVFLGKKVTHPGMRAKPFFGPLIERVTPKIVAEIQRRLRETINNYIAGL